jgi:streptogramin lyase
MAKRLIAVFCGVIFAFTFAKQAFAGVDGDPGGGYIEVCKAANSALSGQFQFRIHDSFGDQSATIGLGACTAPIAVDVPGPGSSNVTVTELGGLTGLTNQGTLSSTPDTSFLTATASAVGANGPTGCASTGFACTVAVPPSPNGTSNVVTVTFSDSLVTGAVEVCKAIVAGSGLTGTWSFAITGANGFNQTVSAPAGACAPPVTVPAGRVKVQETGDASENVTQITALNAAGADVTLGPDAGPAADLPTATIVAAVAAGDVSKQTIVTMTNNSVRLKLCKYVDAGGTPGTYTFALSATGNSGPTAVPASVNLTATTANNSLANAVCTLIGPLRAGTAVSVSEAIVPGTKVGSITVDPTTDGYSGGPVIVPGSLDLPNRSVKVIVGAGETVVTYEDVAAAPGLLKLCKVASLGTVTEFTSGLNPGASPAALTAGPGGNVWFADQGTTKAIGEITPTGAITEFPLPATSKPADIEEGPDGNLWFTDQGTTKAIGRMTPTGVVTEFSAGLNAGSLPNGLTVGPDGNLWFADRGTTKAIGRITTSGVITEFPLPATTSPRGIVDGPDGNLWFTDAGTPSHIARMTTTGTVTNFSVGLNAGSSPRAIDVGPDGNLWFNDMGTTKAMGRITTSGTITEFSAGLSPGSAPADIAPGPDGNVWFNDRAGALGQITPSGSITESSDGLPAGSSPRGLALGPDDNMWFGDDGTTKAIGRLTIAGPFTFTVGTKTVTVPPNACIVVGTFPYDTSLVVTEAAVPNITVTSITAVPQFVQVLEGAPPAAVNTAQPTLTNVNLTTRSATVTIGENNTTEVTFTNKDPAPGSDAVGSDGGSSGATAAGGGSGSSSTTGGGITSNPVVSAPVALPTTLGIGAGSSAGAATPAKVKAELVKTAKLKALERLRRLDEIRLRTLRTSLHHTAGRKVRHDLTTEIDAISRHVRQLTHRITAFEA